MTGDSRLKFILIYSICCCLVHPKLYAQSESLQKELISLSDEYLRINPEASGVIASVSYPSADDWKYSTGSVGRDEDTALSGNERFIAASITKTFVATCILQQEEEGLLSINDKVIQYLDESTIKKLTEYNGKSYEQELTLEHLLRHTSGIFDYLNKGQVHLNGYKNQPEREYTLQERIDFALELGAATHKPGKYGYSNTNYILLGIIAEKVDNATIADIIDRRIVVPLGLKNTSLRPSDDVIPQMLKGYYTDWDLTGFTLHFNKLNPAGGILTNVDDLSVFARALFQGKLFESKVTLQKMLDFKKGYGLGVMLFDTSKKTGRVMGHSGFDPGYTCYLAYLEDLDITVVTVINQSELVVKMPAFLIVKIVHQLKTGL
ncbi:serine hydrolase domain-containing protein [Ulvibacterium marinum]|uniref:Class A beta-lactamase-related serine hydrolase n=1 Tax=Ulvibacterium marinum TaxID=2419782 RepID=A0A3B0C1T6_9FLAO|nr:serine hydrolase domain-containing protein [Ulvibacterium marinum]RKN79813.1 class A beta-lactamase-related serine hydrolase [Ulvibacterium marinum]